MIQLPARFPKLTALLAGFVAATGFEPLKLWPVTLACFALLLWLIETAPPAAPPSPAAGCSASAISPWA